jgi:Glycosidases
MIKIISLAIVLCTANCNKNQEGLPSGNTTFNDPAFSNVPNVADMVVYEVNIPAFSSSGNLSGATQRLDSIKNLGINVIWLMPIYPIGYTNAVGSPYCVNNYKAVNPSFGTLDDLRTFVREAHKRNMAVILDWVGDHTSWDNSWIQHKSWYNQDANGNIISPPGTGWMDVAQLNYSNSTMRDEMIKCLKYWITQSNVDGYRFDAVDFVPSNFWQQAIDTLKAMPGRKMILLAEGGKAVNFTDGFQMNYSWDFVTTLKSVFGGAKARTIFSADSVEYSVVPSGSQKLRYITNHDLNYNSSLIDDYYTPEGSLAAYVITSFLRGVPLIYDGQEVAYPNKISFFQSGTPTQVTWEINGNIYNEYKKLMGVRNSLPSVKNGSVAYYADDNVAAFKRTYQGEEVLVLVNVRNSSSSFVTPFSLLNTSWTNLLNNNSVTLSTTVSLDAYSFLVLKKQP